MKKVLKARNYLFEKISNYLTRERDSSTIPLCDFNRFRFEVLRCDIILVEGQSRLSDVIKTLTLSQWTHAAIYIGRLTDIEDDEVKLFAEQHSMYPPGEPLIVEAIMGEGVILAPLSKYKKDNLRICRAKYMDPLDAQKVINHTLSNLGKQYHTRQILDIARFMLPYSLLPKKFRSTLFEHNAGNATKTICSTMLAEAFAKVQYPIMPVVRENTEGNIEWIRRRSTLFVPNDFDKSPYFDIIKYPFMGNELAVYRKLPWSRTGVVHDETASTIIEELNEEKEESV